MKKKNTNKIMYRGVPGEPGFTLIELLAVIVILGLLMAIAIPSVTKYIMDSRKKTLVSSFDAFIKAATSSVSDSYFGKLDDENKLYYIQVSNIPDESCVNLEKGGDDPFGNYMEAYVVVHYNQERYTHDFYITFIDDAGYGMELTKSDALSTNGKQIKNPSPVTKDTITKQTKAIISVNGDSEDIKTSFGDKIDPNNIVVIRKENECMGVPIETYISDAGLSPLPATLLSYCFYYGSISNTSNYHSVYNTNYSSTFHPTVFQISKIMAGYTDYYLDYLYFVAKGTPAYNCVKNNGGSYTYCLNLDGKTTALKTDYAKSNTYGCYVGLRRNIPMCLASDTEIEVYDKKRKKRRKKKLIDVDYDDLILAWDFDLGEEVFVEPLWIAKPATTNSYVLLTFSDGSTLKVINNHRIYNADKGMFTAVMSDDTPIGTRTYSSSGEYVTLVSKEEVEEEVTYCNMITNRHINFFGNGILTSWRLNNIYEIKDMKFVKEERTIKTKEDLSEIPEEWIDGVRAMESPDSIEQIISDYNFCKERKK